MKTVAPMSLQQAIFRTFRRIVLQGARGLDMVAAAAIVAMMTLTCADVVLRFFRKPITGTYEIVAFLGALGVSCAVAHTSAEKGHVAVTLVVQLLPKRLQGVVEGCIALLSLLLFALISWQSVLYGLSSQRAGEVSLTLQFPLYPIIYGVAFGTGIVCLVCLVDLFDAIRKVRASSQRRRASSQRRRASSQRRNA